MGSTMSASSGRRRPTIKDVADRAGVSHATVSRYLTKNSYVSPAAGHAIEAAIEAVRYVPNRSARSLVQQKSHFVALVVREHSDLFFSDPNLSRMATAANDTLGAAGYQMLLLIVDDDASARRVSDLVRGGFVDGAILLALNHDDPILEGLRGTSIPMATSSSPRGAGTTPSVDTENVAGAESITRMLLRTGRTRVAEIRGPRGAPVSPLRHEGFVRATEESLIVSGVDAAAWTVEAGAAAMADLLARHPDIDGVVAASDALAAGALRELQRGGRRVPEDVGVVGFDDSPLAAQTQPPLSTVAQDSAATGRRLAEIVLRQIDGHDMDDHHEVLPNKVVWRESAGSIPDADDVFA